jgi:class 3 adenylate cyclase
MRIGLHAAGATQVRDNFTGKGVHEAPRISGLAEGGEILASSGTAVGGRFPVSEPRTVTVRGIGEPIEVVSVDWR